MNVNPFNLNCFKLFYLFIRNALGLRLKISFRPDSNPYHLDVITWTIMDDDLSKRRLIHVIDVFELRNEVLRSFSSTWHSFDPNQ